MEGAAPRDWLMISGGAHGPGLSLGPCAEIPCEQTPSMLQLSPPEMGRLQITWAWGSGNGIANGLSIPAGSLPIP